MRASVNVLAGAVLILTTTTADANFVVTSDPARQAPVPDYGPATFRPQPGVIADTPHLDPGDRQAAPAPSAPQAARPRAPVVRGFGDQVPLSFACKQILPGAVKVIYGPGADPAMLVTWRGGDTWPHVLGQAIKPLGLHIVARGLHVEIEA